MDRAKASASQLLSYLDFLRPLLLQDRSLVKVALARFEFLQSQVKPPDPPLTLGTYDMSKVEARKFFPTENPSFEKLLDLLSVSNRILGPRVILLDLLTVLALLVRGNLEEKAQYLFDWYNISKTGVLSEVEHTMLIMRISNCLHRMKIIGALDVTEEDARHIAMTSRVYRETEKNKGASINDFVGVEEDKDNFADDINSHRSKYDLSKIRFLPGLRFVDFVRWCRTSKEANVLSRFVKVLDRLSDSLLVLDARTDSIANVVEQKRVHKEKSHYVPRPDILSGLQPASAQANEEGGAGLVKVIFRGAEKVVLAVAARVFSSPVTECFVKVEVLRPVPEPFYPVPVAVQKRNLNSASHSAAMGMPSCCGRVYSHVSYQRCIVRYIPGFPLSSQLVQVAVTGLDPDARHILTVYTTEVLFPAVEARTTPSRVTLYLVPPKLGDAVGAESRGLNEMMQNKGRCQMTLGLLPSSLSVEDALNFIKTAPALSEASLVVVSSTLVSIAEELKQLTLFANTLQPVEGLVDGFVDGFAVSAAVSAYARYAADFERRCSLLYGLTSGNDVRVDGLMAAHDYKQVVYYNGMGPWGSPDALAQVKKHLQAGRSLGGSKWAVIDAVHKALESKYEQFTRPLQLPVAGIEVGPLELYLVGGTAGHDSTAIAAHIRRTYLPSSSSPGEVDAARREEQKRKEGDSAAGVGRVLLFMRSPADLLDPLGVWTKDIPQRNPPVQAPASAPVESMPGESEETSSDVAADALQKGQSRADGEGHALQQEDRGVLVTMPSFGTVVDAPSEKQLEQAKKTMDEEGAKVQTETQVQVTDARDDEEEPAEANNPQQKQEQEEEGNKESEESKRLRDSFEANRWPHQSGKAAGDPNSDYYDATGADLRGVDAYDRLSGRIYFEKRTSGSRTALALAESQRKAEEVSGEPDRDKRIAVDEHESDAGFASLLDALARLVQVGDGSSEKDVMLVSCGWARGVNFEVLVPVPGADDANKKVRIIHHNLLPTRGHATAEHASSNDSHNTAGTTPEDDEVQREEEEHVDLLLGRLRASVVALKGTFTILAASGLRAMSVAADIEFPEIIVKHAAQEEAVDMPPLASQESKQGALDSTGVDGVMPLLATIVDDPDAAQRIQNQVFSSSLSLSTGRGVPVVNVRLSHDFLPWNRIVDKLLQAPGVSDSTPVQLEDGPRLLRVEHDKVVVGCVASGYGRVKCTVYELPFELNYREAVALCASDRKTLRKVTSVTRRCTRRREMQFRFNDLHSYHNYCAILDMWTVTATDERAPTDEMPSVCQFRTLYNAHSKSCSMIVAGVSETDYALPSFSASKIEELLNSARPPAAPVHLLHSESRHYRRGYGPDKPGRVDLQKLSRHANVVHTLGEPGNDPERNPGGSDWTAILGDNLDQEAQRASTLWDDADPALDWAIRSADTPTLQRGGRQFEDSFHKHDSDFNAINISWNGRFCRIAARDGSVRCLQKMTEMVEKLHMWLPEVDNITIFVHKPLLRYLRKLKPRDVPQSADPATYTDAGTFTGTATATATATGATAAAAEMPRSQERWEWDYPNYHHRASSEAQYASVCADLFSVLIRWKAAGVGRDALVVCVAEVKKIQVATVGFALRERRRLERERELEAEATARLPPMDLMSSSVAYSAAEDSSIITADSGSINNASVVLPEGEGGGEGEVPQDEVGAAAVGDGGAEYQVGQADVVTAPDADADADADAGAGAGAAVVDQDTPVPVEGDADTGAGPPDDAQDASAPTVQVENEGSPAESQGGDAADAGATADANTDELAVAGGQDGEGDGAGVEQGPADGIISSSAPATAAIAGGGAPVESGAFPPPPGSPVPKPSTAPANMTLSAVGSLGMGGLMNALSRSRDSAEHNKVGMEEAIPEAVEEGEGDDASVFQRLHEEEMARSVLLEPEPELEPEPLVEEQIRHVILPLYTVPGEEHRASHRPDDDHWAQSQEQIKFAEGMQLLHGEVEYEFDRDPDLADYNLALQPRREHLYGPSIDLRKALEPAKGSFEPAVYLFDVFIRPGEGAHTTMDAPDMASFAGSVEIPSPSSLYSEYTARNEFHFLVLRSYVSDIDLAAIVTGPVIGEVSQTSVRVALEVNFPFRQLTVCCRPLGRTEGHGVPVDEDGDYVNALFDDPKKIHHEYFDGGEQQDVKWVQENVKPYKVFQMHFEGLLPGQPYGIFIPDLFGEERQGFFRTFKEWTRESEAIFMGQNALAGLPVVKNILTQMNVHQISDLRHLVREMHYLFGSKIAALYSTSGEITRHAEMIGGSYPTKPWSFAAEHIQRPCTESVITFHLGSLTLMSHFFDALVQMLITHGRKAHFPISEASCTGAYYFNEFEEIIKDSFRVAWAVPAIQEQLRSGANVPMYLSEYLLSFSTVPEEMKNTEKGASEADVKLLAIIRKVYENQLAAYMYPLYGHTGEGTPSHHGRVYRTGPLAYIVLDIVSGRKKVKKKKKDEENEENKEGEGQGGKKRKTKKEDESARFSVGFLDKEQWKLVKGCAEDKRVTQIIIMTQSPFLHLYPLAAKNEEPESVEKGEMLQWAPTTYDLRMFFTYFTEWLKQKPGEPMQSKTVALVSTDTIPYVTQIQDLPSGTKIQQLVLGDLGVDREYTPPPPAADMDMDGTDGGFSLAGSVVPQLNLTAANLPPAAGGAGEKIIAEDDDLRQERERQQMIVGGTTVVDMTPRSPRPPPSARLEEDLAAVSQLHEQIDKEGGVAAAGAGMGEEEGAVSVQRSRRTRSEEGDEEREGEAYDGDFGAPQMEDLTLTGKIGKFRYVHRFGELDYVHVDASRESIVGGILDRDQNLQELRRGVFATLTFTFDTWKSVGLWRVLDHSENKLKSPGEPAMLLVGPILGPPGLVVAEDKEGGEGPPRFEVGVMIETDRNTTVTFAVRNAMFGSTEHYSYDVECKRPTICKINDLEIDSRYNVTIVGGVRKSHCVPFVISTALSWSDTNVAFANCSFVEGELPQEDFCKELLRRYKVPFNGISATVHLNSNPYNLRECLRELKRLPILRVGLAKAWEVGHLTAELYEAMANAMELIRDVYRRHLGRASYRELLRSGFNLFMHTHDIFMEIERDFEEDADEDEDEDEEQEGEGGAQEQKKEETKTADAAGAGAGAGADGQPAAEEEKKVPYDPVLHLLRLMATRIHQEYFEQLNSMHRNVFRAIEKKEDSVAELNVENLSEEEQARIMEKDKMRGLLMDELSMLDWEEEVEERVHKSNPRGHPVKMVFRQWVQELVPSPPNWRNWVSPNGKLVIERLPCIIKKNLPVMLKQFKKPCDIPFGTRLCVIDNNADDTGLDLAFAEDDRSGQKYWRQAKKWLYPNPLYPDGVEGPKNENGDFEMIDVIRDDRRTCFIGPTLKYGTQKKPIFHTEDDGLHANILTVDSLFRSNQTEKQAKILQVEAESAAETKNQPKATTKKQKERQIEQERLRAEAKKRKLEEVFASFPPDGFLIVEGRCSTDTTSDNKTIAVASLKGHPMMGIANMGTPAENEIYQDETVERPTPYDYVYLPEWVLKYFPSQDGVFAQDEVLLWMRQNEKTARILRILEGDRLVGKVIELYERSRLSELSRPPDLREVDMDVPGVTETFVRDLIEKIWKDVVPGEVKPFLVPIDDDFMRAFILSRAIPDPTAQLSHGEAFAKGVQYALVLAVSMKISLSMQEDPRYKYIMQQPDKSQAAAEYQAGKDAARWKAHERAKIEFGDKYDYDTVEALYEEEAAKALEKEGYESDLEDLEREERFLEEEGDRMDELEEMKERMLDLEEAEAEAREEAENLLDEGGSEEEEEEEDEDIPEDGGALVDEEELEEMKKRKEEKAKAKEKAQGRVGGKTKEQEKAEKEAKVTILLIDSMKPGVDAALEEIFGEAVDDIAAAKLREIEKEESMSNLRQMTDEESLDKLKKHHDRIEKAKIANRRGFGHRLVHLA